MSWTIYLFFIIIFLHWVGDFVFQSDTMAINKSKSIGWLSLHVLIYSLVMLLTPVGELTLYSWATGNDFPHGIFDWFHYGHNWKDVFGWDTYRWLNREPQHWLGLPILFGGWFMAVFVTHWITDFFTSKVSTWLYPRSRHYFFVWIGFDQLIHMWTLLVLYWYLVW